MHDLVAREVDGRQRYFAEEQKLIHAIAANLSIIENIHNHIFNSKPNLVKDLLDRWGRNDYEIKRFQNSGMKTPYLFSPKTFWKTFLNKMNDNSALASMFTQIIHMLNPVFFVDVIKSLINRFNERGTYHLE